MGISMMHDIHRKKGAKRDQWPPDAETVSLTTSRLYLGPVILTSVEIPHKVTVRSSLRNLLLCTQSEEFIVMHSE